MFLIRSLELGGAERQVVMLAKTLAERHEVNIVTFYAKNEYSSLIDPSDKNLRVTSLNKVGRWDLFSFLFRFVKLLRNTNPDVLYSFMNTASIIAAIVSPFVRHVKYIWGIRSSNMDNTRYGLLYRCCHWLEIKLSLTADLVISNSSAGKNEAVFSGFDKRKLVVIPNGIDSEFFQYSEVLCREVRDELGIDADSFVIGCVARHDPMKGLDVLLNAAKEICQLSPRVTLLIVGSGTAEYTRHLKALEIEYELIGRIKWVDKTTDVLRYYSAMTIYTSASVYGEGFSNAIAEAMLCNLPCVVTKVGDSSEIIGPCGIAVNPGDIDAIVNAWSAYLSKSREDLLLEGKKARARVIENFSVESMSRTTETAFTQLMN